MSPQDPMPQQRLLRNVTSGWAQRGIVTVIAFFLSPFLVHTLGTERYGIWALVLAIITYIDLLDVGMKQSLSRFFSRYYATRDWQALNEIVNTSTVVYAVTGGLALLASLVVAYFFLGVIKVAPELVPDLRATLIIAGVSQAVTFFFMTGTALGPFHRYDISNTIWGAYHIVSAAVIVVLLRFGHGLVGMALGLLAVNLAMQLIRRGVQRRIVPQVRFHPRFVKRERIRELIDYGLISFFIVMSWKLVSSVQNVLVSVFVSVATVTYYSIAGQVINYLRLVINAIAIPLVPVVSHLEATGQQKDIARLQGRIMGYLYYLTAAVTVGILFFSRRFISLWMGPGFEDSVRILDLLAIPACISLPQVTAHSVLLGMSRHKALAQVLLVEGAATLLLSTVLVKTMGLIGVAWGTAIPQIAVYVFIYPRVFQRAVGGDLRAFYVGSGRMLALAAICTLPPALVVRSWSPLAGWPGLLISAAVVGAAGCAGFWCLVLDRGTRSRLLDRVRRRLRPQGRS